MPAFGLFKIVAEANFTRILSRPITWVAGILLAIMGSYVTTFFNEQAKPIINSLAQLACKIETRQPASDESKFTILISPPVDDDANHTQLHRILETFFGARGFRPVPICETVAFDFDKISSQGLDAVEKATLSRAREIIAQNRADLLLFGSVIRPNASLKIWTVNELGGCDLHPTPTMLDGGSLPEQFNRQTEMELLKVTLTAIASACKADSSTDWNAFKTRIEKLSRFLNEPPPGLTTDQLFEISSSYSEAMTILYENHQGDEWLTKALTLDRQLIAKLTPTNTHYQRYLAWNAYGFALVTRAGITKQAADWDAAMAAYSSAISEAGEDAGFHDKYTEAFGWHGQINLDAGKVDEAVADFTQEIHFMPDSDDGYHDRGNAYYRKGEYDHAIADFSEAIRLNPKDASTYANRGNAYFAMGNYNRAEEDFSSAIALEPKNAGLLAFRASNYVAQKELDKAISDADEAIRIDGGNAKAFETRANAFNFKKEYEKAISDASEAIRLDPADALALEIRAVSCYPKRKYDCTIADVGKLIALNPQFLAAPSFRSNLLDYRGLSYQAEADYDRSIVDFDQAIALNQKNAMLYINRGDSYFKKSDYDHAIADYQQSISIDAQNGWYFVKLGFAYYAKKDYDNAIANYSVAMSLDPKLVDAFNNRGHAYRHKKNCDLAVVDFNHALELKPQFFPALAGRGFCYYAMKQYQLAISDWQIALQVVPEQPEQIREKPLILFGLGSAMEKMGDVATGQRNIEAASAQMPNVAEQFAASF